MITVGQEVSGHFVTRSTYWRLFRSAPHKKTPREIAGCVSGLL